MLRINGTFIPNEFTVGIPYMVLDHMSIVSLPRDTEHALWYMVKLYLE